MFYILYKETFLEIFLKNILKSVFIAEKPSCKFKTLKKRYFFIIGIIAVTAALCVSYFRTDTNQNKNHYENNTQKDFDNYANRLFLEQLSSDSLSMHFYMLHPEQVGLENIPQTLGTYSYDTMVESQKYYINEINNLKTFDYNKLLQNQKITFDVMLQYFKNQLDFADLCLCSEILSPTTGLQAQLPILFAEYSFTCKQDVDNYLTLLSQLKEYYGQICEFQKLKAEKNCFISEFSCDGIISQCKEFIGDCTAESNYLYSSFNNKITNCSFLSDDEKNFYLSKNKTVIEDSVIPAYQLLMNTLSALKKQGLCKNNNGLYYLENGCDYYEYLVKTYTGSSRSVIELKADIQAHLANDMTTMFSILTSNPELEERFYSDFQNTLTPDEILSDLMEIAKSDFPLSNDIEYEIKYVDKSLENNLSPAFYLSPPIDNNNNNVIYINNGSKTSSQNLYTTLAHEGIPGHMYQSSFFMNTNPLPIRHLINYGGYTEGWATYVEFISYFYENKDEQLAQALSCSASYSLALYSLCDIGINYEGWTLDDTKNFLANYNIEDEKVCESIFQAVIEEPANYLQYYVGYLEILNLKNSMQEQFGTSFNLKKFHEAYLKIGPADFNTVAKWISYEYSK